MLFPRSRFTVRHLVRRGGMEYYQQIRQYYDIGLWPMWERPGAATVEDIINGYNVTPTNVTFGQAGIGDGKTAGVFTYPNSLLNVGIAGVQGKFSPLAGMASLWLKIPTGDLWTDGNAYAFFSATADNTNRIYMRKNGDMSISLAYYATTLKQVTLPVQCSLRWMHWIAVWNKAEDYIKLYCNGIQAKQATTGLGNFAGSLAAGNPMFAQLTGSVAYPGLSTIIPTDLQIYNASSATGQIVFDGDSRSAKGWTYAAAEAAFPAGVRAYGGRAVATWAISGAAVGHPNPAVDLALLAPTGIDTLLKSGVYSVLIIWSGVNTNASLTAQQIYDALKAYCLARRAAGWNRIVLCTEIASTLAGWNDKKDALNALIAADYSFADALADLGADSRLQNASDATYYTDGTHLTDAGYAVVAGIVTPVLATL